MGGMLLRITIFGNNMGKYNTEEVGYIFSCGFKYQDELDVFMSSSALLASFKSDRFDCLRFFHIFMASQFNICVMLLIR